MKNIIKTILKFVKANPTIISAVTSFIIELATSGKVDSTLLLGIVAAIGAGKAVHKKVTTGSVI